MFFFMFNFFDFAGWFILLKKKFEVSEASKLVYPLRTMEKLAQRLLYLYGYVAL